MSLVNPYRFGVGTAPLSPSGASGGYNSASGEIVVTWTDNSNNELGFNIYRSVDGGSYSLYDTTTVSSYTDSSFSGGETFQYQINAYNAAGESGPTFTTAIDTLPHAPTGAAASWTGTSMVITWTDNSSIETGYKIYRKVNSGSYTLLDGALAANTTSYNDSTTSSGNSYTYRVTAYNSNGESANSESNTVVR